PKPDGNEDPAGETGWFLQRERERRGQTLADAALATQISARSLQAIEMGRLQDLPPRSYVLGYVRVYADYLGLEGEPLVQQYSRLLADAEPPRQSASGRFGRTMMFAAATLMLLVAVTAGVWHLMPELADGRRQIAEGETALPMAADESIRTGSIERREPEDAAADRIAEMLDDAVP